MYILDWTPARLSRIRELRQQGISVADVARIISGDWGFTVTKSMVAGVIARRLADLQGIRYSGPKKWKKQVNQPEKIAPPASALRKVSTTRIKPASVRRPIKSMLLVEAPVTAGVSFLDLGRTSCRYAVAATDEGSHLFCGATKKDGSSYCPFHHGVVYVPNKKRVREKHAFKPATEFAGAASFRLSSE